MSWIWGGNDEIQVRACPPNYGIWCWSYLILTWQLALGSRVNGEILATAHDEHVGSSKQRAHWVLCLFVLWAEWKVHSSKRISVEKRPQKSSFKVSIQTLVRLSSFIFRASCYFLLLAQMQIVTVTSIIPFHQLAFQTLHTNPARHPRFPVLFLILCILEGLIQVIVSTGSCSGTNSRWPRSSR